MSHFNDVDASAINSGDHTQFINLPTHMKYNVRRLYLNLQIRVSRARFDCVF